MCSAVPAQQWIPCGILRVAVLYSTRDIVRYDAMPHTALALGCRPDRYHEGIFACFEHFVSDTDVFGKPRLDTLSPTGGSGSGSGGSSSGSGALRCLPHIAAVLHAAIAAAIAAAASREPSPPWGTTIPPPSRDCPVTLVGFSKGSVVTNEALVEARMLASGSMPPSRAVTAASALCACTAAVHWVDGIGHPRLAPPELVAMARDLASPLHAMLSRVPDAACMPSMTPAVQASHCSAAHRAATHHGHSASADDAFNPMTVRPAAGVMHVAATPWVHSRSLADSKSGVPVHSRGVIYFGGVEPGAAAADSAPPSSRACPDAPDGRGAGIAALALPGAPATSAVTLPSAASSIGLSLPVTVSSVDTHSDAEAGVGGDTDVVPRGVFPDACRFVVHGTPYQWASTVSERSTRRQQAEWFVGTLKRHGHDAELVVSALPVVSAGFLAASR